MGGWSFNPYYEWLGIQPSEQPADHYRLLGIARFEGNTRVIERAADRQMGFVRQFQAKHPAEVADLLSQLSLARITLTNGEKKLLYDNSLKIRQVRLQPLPPMTVPEAPAKDWYIQSCGISQGPFTTGELQARIKAKEVRADTMVRNGPAGRWMLAREARGLFDLPVSPPPAPGTVPQFTSFEPMTESADLLSGPMPSPEDRSPGPNVWVCPDCRWPVPKPKTHCSRCGFVKRVNDSRVSEQRVLLMLLFAGLAIIAVAIAFLIAG
jgi:predicted nucleic acid-binding Zn ribbon protein